MEVGGDGKKTGIRRRQPFPTRTQWSQMWALAGPGHCIGEGWGGPWAPGAGKGTQATGKGRRVRAETSGCGKQPSPASLPGSEQQACGYHVLKSLKPPLGFFLATGTAALVDGSSSAPRFLGREEAGASCCGGQARAGSHVFHITPTPSLISSAAPRPPSSRSLLNPRSASTWTHPANGHQLPPTHVAAGLIYLPTPWRYVGGPWLPGLDWLFFAVLSGAASASCVFFRSSAICGGAGCG